MFFGKSDVKYDYNVYQHPDDVEGEYSLVVQLPDGTAPLKKELNFKDVDVRFTFGDRPYFKMLVSPWFTDKKTEGAGYQFLTSFIDAHPDLQDCEVFKEGFWWNLNTTRKSLSLTEEQVIQLAQDAAIALKEFAPLKVSDRTQKAIDALMKGMGFPLPSEVNEEKAGIQL